MFNKGVRSPRVVRPGGGKCRGAMIRQKKVSGLHGAGNKRNGTAVLIKFIDFPPADSTKNTNFYYTHSAIYLEKKEQASHRNIKQSKASHNVVKNPFAECE